MKKLELTRRERWIMVLAAGLVLLGVLCFSVSGTKFLGYLCVEAAAVCPVWIWLCRRGKSSRKWMWCKRLFAAGLAAMLLLLVVLEVLIVSYGEQDNLNRPADAMIVLGAGIKDAEPSPALKTRLNMARTYMERHPEIPVVVSGGLGLGETVTEGEVMKAYLSTGDTVWDSRIYPECRATSTAENFRYSKEILKELGIDPEEAVIAVVTNDFHMLRTHLIARRCGMEIIGISAELPWWWVSLACYVRESFALVKTFLFD